MAPPPAPAPRWGRAAPPGRPRPPPARRSVTPPPDSSRTGWGRCRSPPATPRPPGPHRPRPATGPTGWSCPTRPARRPGTAWPARWIGAASGGRPGEAGQLVGPARPAWSTAAQDPAGRSPRRGHPRPGEGVGFDPSQPEPPRRPAHRPAPEDVVQPQAAERASVQLRHQPERRPATAGGTGGAVDENGVVSYFHAVFAYRRWIDQRRPERRTTMDHSAHDRVLAQALSGPARKFVRGPGARQACVPA